MSFNLRFVFSGPIMYVPSSDGKTLRVLVVDASEPDPGSDQSIHVPVLLFDRDTLIDADGLTVVPFLKGNVRRGAIFLDREELHLETTPPQGASQTLRLDRTSPFDPSADRFSFDLIPTLQKVCPGCGPIDNAALLDTPPPNTVAVRASLTRGDVFTATLSRRDGLLVPWQVEPNSNARFLGLDAGVELECEGEVGLQLTSYETGKTRTLRFQPTAGTARLDLELSNREPARVFSAGFREDALQLSLGTADHDFAYHYRLAAQSIAAAQMTIPTVAAGLSNSSGTTCGGVQGNPQP